MRIIAILLTLSTITLSGITEQTYWCVQIASSNNLSELKVAYEKIKNTTDIRIEKIGTFYTIRAGFYQTKNQAEEIKKLLENQNIRNTLIRRCYLIKERIIFPEDFKEPERISTAPPQKNQIIAFKEVTDEDTSSKASEILEEKYDKMSITEQNAEIYTELLKQEEKLRDIVNKIKLLFTAEEKEIITDITVVDTIFATPDFEPSSTKAGLLLKEQKQDAEQNNKGLKLTGQYIYNENTGLIEDEDTISYKWRGYLGLEWDILREGLRQYQSKRKQIENELKIDKILADKKIRYEMYPFYRNEIICLFNKAKSNVLKKKIELLSEYEQVIKNLYFAHIVEKEDVQNIQKEIWRAKNMLEGYAEYEKNLPPEMLKRIKQIDAGFLPSFSIKIKKVQQSIENPSLRKAILSLQKSILSEKYDVNYNVRFAPFLRYYFGRTDTGKRNINDYFSLGFYFSLPLPLSEEKTTSVQNAEEKYLETLYDRNVKNDLHDVMNTYYEYVYKIDDLIRFLYQKQIILEQIRKRLVKLDMKDELFSMPELISKSIQYLNTEFEILHIKQLLYLNLAFIVKYIPDTNISQFIIPINIEKDIEMYAKQRIGERSVYIWSQTFNKFDNGLIYWFLKTKSAKNPLISFGKNTDKEKLKEFLNLAGNSLHVEALIGNNDLLKQKNNLTTLISELSNYGFSGIHLDIEPYTMSGWQTNSEQYLQMYFDLLQLLKKNPYLKDKTLTVSIPIFYPEDFLKKIFPIVNKVYVMAYGTKNPDTVAKWIRKITELDKTKVVVALRCKDFNNEIELENFITEIKNLIDVSSFAIHSLTEYIETGGSYEAQNKTSIY